VPIAPKDLLQHQCIVVPRSDDTYGAWTFTRGDSVETIKVRGNLRCNDSEVAMAWALEGRGILMRSSWDTGRFARAEALKLVLSDYALPNRDLFIVFHNRGAMSAKVRTFIDFAVERLSGLDLIDTLPVATKSPRGSPRRGNKAATR
jgi:DNA-binding transcriptional LysR family regulator